MKKIGILLLISVIFVACSNQKENNQKEITEREYAIKEKEAQTTIIYIKEIMQQAKKGRIQSTSNNVLGSTIEQVKKEWGNPDQIDQAGNGYYATYKEYDTVFGYHVLSGEIFDIRSYKKELQAITMDTLEDVIGKPSTIRNLETEVIAIYQPADQIELKFILPKTTNTVDHISVFNPVLAGKVEDTNEYTLTIMGTSNALSPSAWAKMQEWRNQIVEFAQNQDNMYINGPNKKQVAITFDDGPDQSVTPAIIDILNAHRVVGNFFFIGSQAEKYPDVVKKAAKNNHLVLNHSYNHKDLTTVSTTELQNEIKKTATTIKSIIGKEPAIIRPPYGETSTEVVNTAKQNKYSIVLWSIDTLDWSQMEKDNILQNVVENIRNGDIILMHSDAEKTETAKALPAIIEALQQKGIDIVGLDELLNIPAYQ